MKRIHIKDLNDHREEEVTIAGWIDTRRDHGKLIFLDVRDETGKIQAVVLPGQATAHNLAGQVRSEWVVRIKGLVKQRPEKMVNPDEVNGNLELEVFEFEVLNEAQTPPFDLTEDTSDIEESVRLKYRYLDLRSSRMQKNLRMRSRFVQKCREFLFRQDFTEIETPILTESTPEGSRDFVVPSRLHPGNFYALPQSPQQYKQLLMTGGFEKYFQIARAVRDEDLRADRGFEHTQLDLEMAFVEREDILQVIEAMIIETVESLGFTVKTKPFPRVTFKEAMDKYGADKFDLRTEDEKRENVLAYAWVLDFPLFEKTDDGRWTFTHNPFSMPIQEHVDWLLNGENIAEIITSQYDLVCNGFEAGGGSIRAHRPEILKATYKVMGFSDKEIEEKVGHMLEAFSYGAPPHGGIALGIERNIMNLTGEAQLREVQAFPMTRSGQTAVMKAPKDLSGEQLKELGLDITDRE